MASPSRTIRVRFDGNADGLAKAARDGADSIKKFQDDLPDIGVKGGRGFSGSFMDAVKAGFKASVPNFISEFGSTFTSGLKGVISSPVIGPIIIAALAGVAVMVAPAAATFIGGAIVAGVGAGLVGLGVLILAQNEKVKAQFSKTFSEIKTILMDAAKPLLPVLAVVRSVLKGLVQEFAPVLKAGFSLVQGPLKGFIKDLGRAFAELKPAIEPFMEALGNILRSLGPQLPGLFQSISKSLVGLANSVGKNSDIFAAFISALLMMIPPAIDAITFLIKAFRKIVDITFKVGAAALGMADTVLGALQSIVNAIARVPGPWQDTFRKVSAAIGQGRAALQHYKRQFEITPKIVQLRGDIRDLDNKLARARAQLKDPNLTKERRAKLNADIQALLRRKSQAQAAINGLQGKTVYINAVYRGPGGVRAEARASGGPVMGGRTYLVGERGPELFTAPTNGHIVPNHDLARSGDIEVKVFIGDQELKGIVRTEISERDRSLKRRATSGVAR
ncbi:hypothetical protein [Nonomuraea sp. SYSU D8015]|uniref:hypothetical protein n=1 Tax=Nonomuraea sp. SYSU D8015 TaxID=2593644 RepID=UPI001660934F|nr:hypothetical protein [Nonomuraea sp. SYSU D8015]